MKTIYNAKELRNMAKAAGISDEKVATYNMRSSIDKNALYSLIQDYQDMQLTDAQVHTADVYAATTKADMIQRQETYISEQADEVAPELADELDPAEVSVDLSPRQQETVTWLAANPTATLDEQLFQSPTKGNSKTWNALVDKGVIEFTDRFVLATPTPITEVGVSDLVVDGDWYSDPDTSGYHIATGFCSWAYRSPRRINRRAARFMASLSF
jgi:hypothetical protein